VTDPAAELQPVLGRKKPAQRVAARDFARPRRLSPERAKAFALTLENHLPALEKRLREACGQTFGLKLAGLDEGDADGLLRSLAEPLCVLRFRAAKALGWLLWDSAAAVAAVEAVFGARAAAATARRLSPSETRVATQLLGEVARGVAEVLGTTLSEPALVQVATELGDWHDAGPEAESHRLVIALEIRAGEGTSLLRVCLPGLSAGADAATAAPLPESLPAHLEHLEVELSACLSGCALTLDQLLALEEGDVIPLEARLGDPTTLSVEGLTLAQARLGSHQGRLAVRIERLDVQAETAA